MLHRGDEQLLDLLLNRAAALTVEAGGQLLDEFALPLLDHSAKLLGEWPDLALELGFHVVDVRCGPLALDHAGADLDRARNRLGRLVALPDLLLDHARRGGIVHLEPLDHQAVTDGADGAIGSIGLERQLWLLGRFHGTFERSRETGREPDRGRLTTIHASTTYRRGSHIGRRDRRRIQA